MSPDGVLVFLEVARAGSISAASRKSGQDPATVARHIARLEEQLGTTLFAKSPKGYALTEDGQALMERAEALEALTREIAHAFEDERDTLSGRVRIGAPDGCAAFLLPQVLAGLAQDHPDLVVELVATSRELDLLRREVDIAVSVAPPRAKAVSCTHLADYELHFAALPSEGDTDTSPLISYIPELLVDPGLDLPEAFRKTAPRLRSNSVLVQWAWLRAGAGMGLVHDFALAQAPELARMHPGFAIERSYYLNVRRHDMRFERTRRLVEALRSRFCAEIARARGLAQTIAAPISQ